jgi:transposase-like protein
MPKSHRSYAPEFRERIIELLRKGRTPEELARQFEPSAQAIRNWVRARITRYAVMMRRGRTLAQPMQYWR